MLFFVGFLYYFIGINLIFDCVFFNCSGWYSLVIGYFIVKESGVYVFYFYVLFCLDVYIWVDLYYDYYYIDFLYGGFDDEYVMGSNVVVLNLVVGDIVFLKFR